MTGKPRQERKNNAGRQAINRHLYHHHGHTCGSGTVEQRLQLHDDLHWQARNDGSLMTPYHTHEPYQDGETTNEMAERLLAEGTAAQSQE